MTPTLPTSATLRDLRHRRLPTQTAVQPLRPEYHAAPQWHIPVYDVVDADNVTSSTRRVRQPVGPNEDRRDSGGSDATLHDDRNNNPYKKYSLSSYEHPYDIPPPPEVYSSAQAATPSRFLRSSAQRGERSSGNPRGPGYQPGERPETSNHGYDETDVATNERELRRRGILSNYLDLYMLNLWGSRNDEERPQGGPNHPLSRADSDYSPGYTRLPPNMRRFDSMASNMSNGSDMFDPDDPRVTGITKKYLDDPEDLEKNALRQMDYKARRKERQRIKIEFNICCMSRVPPHFHAL
jgi:hypothetical protein